MKVCLYLEAAGLVAGSGFKTAFERHREALEAVGVEVTSDPHDSYELLHTHWFGLRSLFYVKKSRRRGIPVVCHAHSMGAHDFRDSFAFSNLLAPLYDRYLRYYYNRADAVFTSSRFAKSMLEKGGLKVPVYVAPNAADTNGLRYNPEKRERFRTELGLKRFTFFSSGNLLARKGVEDFLDIAEALPQYDFVWYGKSWKGLATKRSMKRRLRNPPGNVLLPGFVTDIEGAYSAGDALFFPSYTENQPMVLLECASLGLPLIVRNIPEYECFLTHGEDCLTAETNEEFIAHLKAVAEDEELRRRLEAGSLETAKAHSLEAVGQHLKELYARLVAEMEKERPAEISSARH